MRSKMSSMFTGQVIPCHCARELIGDKVLEALTSINSPDPPHLGLLPHMLPTGLAASFQTLGLSVGPWVVPNPDLILTHLLSLIPDLLISMDFSDGSDFSWISRRYTIPHMSYAKLLRGKKIANKQKIYSKQNQIQRFDSFSLVKLTDNNYAQKIPG